MKARRWRDLGRPESGLVGVQYVGYQRIASRAGWVVRGARARTWLFAGPRDSAPARVSPEAASRSIRSRPHRRQACKSSPRSRRSSDRACRRTYELLRDSEAAQMVLAAGAFHLTRGGDVGPRRVANARESVGSPDDAAMRTTCRRSACSRRWYWGPQARRTAVPPALVCKLPRDSRQILPPTRGMASSITCRSTRRSRSRRHASARGRSSSSSGSSRRAERGGGTRYVPQPMRGMTRGLDLASPTTEASSSSTLSDMRSRAGRRSSTSPAPRPSSRQRSGAASRPRRRNVEHAGRRSRATPAGPILRWHSHVVCKQRQKRGLNPPASGVCPPRSAFDVRERARCSDVWFTLRPSQRLCHQRAESRSCALPAFCRGAPADDVERFLSGRTNRGPCDGESARVLSIWRLVVASSRARRPRPPRTRRRSRDEIPRH